MKIRKWLGIALAAVMVLTLFGCASNDMATDSAMNGGSYDRYYAEQESVAMAPELSQQSEQADLPEGRKWIITVDMQAETEDLDALMAQVRQQISALDGYVEDQNIYNGSTYSNRRYRYANLTIRIPAEQVDGFTEQLGTVSNVVSSNKRLEDVTLTYVSTESRMKALQVEEERLLALMEKAETMADLLEIEARLTEVRYELERVTSQLRVYDNLVDYATINLNIEEVQEYTPVEEETLWQRIANGFMDSLKGLGNFFLELLVFLLVNIPYLALIAGIIFLIVFLCRRAAKKRKANRPPRSPYPPYPPQNYPNNPPAPPAQPEKPE